MSIRLSNAFSFLRSTTIAAGFGKKFPWGQRSTITTAAATKTSPRLWPSMNILLGSRSLGSSVYHQFFNGLQQFRFKHTLKTNRSVAKRFRRRGDGTLKRSKSGASHNTGYKTRARSNRLGQSTTITNRKMEQKMMRCMPK